MRTLWFGQNVKEAVDFPRLHHQVYPMTVDYEYGTLQVNYIYPIPGLQHTMLCSFNLFLASD